MNVFEQAARRYGELVPADVVAAKPVERHRQLQTSKIEAWIANQALPAIAEMWDRPIFREHATWAQQLLVSGSESAERALVDQVDAALVAEAKSLKTLLRSKLIQRQLDALHGAAVAARVESESAASEDGESWTVGMPTKHELIPYYRSRIDDVAKRPWTDLVCVEDYFGPTGGMLQKTPLPPGTTEGAMVVSLTPCLFHVGAHVVRCLLQRIRVWTSFLAEVRGICYEALERVNRSFEQHAARRFGVSASRISQIRKYLMKNWLSFVGERPAESVRAAA